MFSLQLCATYRDRLRFSEKYYIVNYVYGCVKKAVVMFLRYSIISFEGSRKSRDPEPVKLSLAEFPKRILPNEIQIC
jgi:hypothetical protein